MPLEVIISFTAVVGCSRAIPVVKQIAVDIMSKELALEVHSTQRVEISYKSPLKG